MAKRRLPAAKVWPLFFSLVGSLRNSISARVDLQDFDEPTPSLLESRLALNAESDSVAFVAGQEAATAEIRERFEVHEMLWRQDLRTRRIAYTGDYLPLPKMVTDTFGNAKELDVGNFGEVWKATNKETGQDVVVKMFYSYDRNGNKFHLTWNKAKGNADLELDLKAAIDECRVAKEMENKKSHNPKHASRIMRCLEDHTSKGNIGADEALYLINEDCAGKGGKNLLKWMNNHKELLARKSPKYYLKVLFHLFKQMMEGLSFIVQSGYVHHDIKPENVMVKKGSDGKNWIKIIDFGGIMKIDGKTQGKKNCKRKDLVASPFYAAPEWFDRSGDNPGFSCKNPSSFDVYAMAVVLDEIVTGQNLFEKMENYHTPKPEAAWMNQCVADGYSKSSCRTKWVDETIKLKGGVENNFTGRFSEEAYRNSEEGAAAVEEMLMESRVVSSALQKSVAAYKAYARTFKWYPVFMQMLAFDHEKRATPDDVLASSFMESRTTHTDPDNASSRKKSKSGRSSRHRSKSKNSGRKRGSAIRKKSKRKDA